MDYAIKLCTDNFDEVEALIELADGARGNALFYFMYIYIYFLSNFSDPKGTIARGYNLDGKVSLLRGSAADDLGSYDDYY